MSVQHMFCPVGTEDSPRRGRAMYVCVVESGDAETRGNVLLLHATSRQTKEALRG